MNSKQRYIMSVCAAVSMTVCAAVVGAGLLTQGSPGQAKENEPSRLFELRTYTTHPGKLPALHARFRDHTMKLFAKHGMKNIAYWTPTDEKLAKNTLVYVVSHANADAAKKSWKGFGSDPAWQAAYKASIEDGKLVKHIERVYMTPTDFSPLKR